MTQMTPEEAQQALERLAEATDVLEDIVSAASEQDGVDYYKWIRIRIRMADGEYFLSITWFGPYPPPGYVVYAPPGFWMARWYKTLNAEGHETWETCMETLR